MKKKYKVNKNFCLHIGKERHLAGAVVECDESQVADQLWKVREVKPPPEPEKPKPKPKPRKRRQRRTKTTNVPQAPEDKAM